MSKVKKVSPTQVAEAINEELAMWTADIQAGVVKLTDQKADELKEELTRRSPKNTKRYSKSWKVKTTKNTFSSYVKVVHNQKHYRLTHLLEKTHKLRNNKMSRRQEHIAPAVEKISKEYYQGIINLIKTSSRNGGGRRY